MKTKLLIPFLFLFAATLHAGWRWEQVGEIVVPYDDHIPQAIYDPVREKIVIVTNAPDDKWSSETYTFDGERFEYLCSNPSSETHGCMALAGQGLYFDEDRQTVVSVQYCYTLTE